MKSNEKNSKRKKDNRRKYSRIKVALNTRFVIVNSDIKEGVSSTPVQAKTKSISINGTCLVTSILQVEGIHIASSTSGLGKNYLKMEIDLSDKPKKTIKPTGEVRWYNLTPKNGELLYNVGVSFLEICEEDSKALKRFIVEKRKADTTHFGIQRKWF